MEQVLIQKKVEQLDKTEILNESDRIFKAWGSVEVIDKDGELLPMDEFKKVMPLIMKRGGNLIDSHSNRVIGKILNYEFKQNPEFNKEGVLLTCQVFKDYTLDNEIWKGIKKGEYTGLSFGGRNKIEEIKFGQNMDPTTILRGLEGYEFSVVQNPANQGATMEEINYLAKSEVQKPFAGFKDFESCVLQMSKKYDKQTANKICGKLQSTTEKIEKEFLDEKNKENQLIKNIKNLIVESEKTEKYINNENQDKNMEENNQNRLGIDVTKEDLILKGINEINETLKLLVKAQPVNEPDGDEANPNQIPNQKPVPKKKVKKDETENEDSEDSESSEDNSEDNSNNDNTEDNEKDKENETDKEALDKMKNEIKEDLKKEIKKELNVSDTPKPESKGFINKQEGIKLPKTFAEANKLARKLIK